MVSFGCLFNRQQRIASAWASTATCILVSFLSLFGGWGLPGGDFIHSFFFYCRLLCREVFQPQEQIPHRVQNRSCCDSSCFCGPLSAEGEETDFPWLGGNSSPADNSSSRISFLTSGLVSHAGVFRGARFSSLPTNGVCGEG